MIGSWQIRLAVFSCAEVYCIRFHCMEAALSGSLKGMGYLKTENRVRAYRTHPTSGLEVSCGLRLALLINSKCFNIFFNIYSFPF